MIGGIAHSPGLVLISLINRSGDTEVAARLLEEFGWAEINIQFIVQCNNQEGKQVVFCVDEDDFERTNQLIQSFAEHQLIDILEINHSVTCLGIYGPDFRLRSGLAGAFLRTLHSANLTIQAISTSISTFSVVIPSNQASQALAAIHESFRIP
jgi:aspartokinase